MPYNLNKRVVAPSLELREQQEMLQPKMNNIVLNINKLKQPQMTILAIALPQ